MGELSAEAVGKRRLRLVRSAGGDGVEPVEKVGARVEVGGVLVGALRVAAVVPAPAVAQPGQSVCTSLHVGAQRPQEVGHALSMNPALLLQSPFFAHALHDTSVSLQVSVHVPHE